MEDVYLERVKQGDVDAFGFFIANYQQTAFRTAMIIVRQEADAKDIVQESFIKAFEAINSFRGDAKFSTWLHRIVVNRSLAWNKNRQKLLQLQNEVAMQQSEENSGEERLLENDRMSKLFMLMQNLTAIEALLLQLHYFEDQSVREIAYSTGLTQSNVKVVMHRGRKKLRLEIEKSKIDGSYTGG